MISEGFKELFEYFTSKAFLMSTLIVVIAMLDFYLIKQYLIKKVAYTGKEDQHRNTFLGVFFNVLQCRSRCTDHEISRHQCRRHLHRSWYRRNDRRSGFTGFFKGYYCRPQYL